MPVGYLQARKGVRLQGGVVDIVDIGNANALAIFQQSTFAAQVGTRTFRIKRIKGINQTLVNTLIHIGTGAAGAVVDVIPEIQTFAGLNFDFVEADLPEVEVNADLMAWAVAGAAALTPVTIQVEIEELG